MAEEEKSNLLPSNPGGFPSKPHTSGGSGSAPLLGTKEYPIVITDKDRRKRWIMGFIGVVIFIALVTVLGVDVEPEYEAWVDGDDSADDTNVYSYAYDPTPAPTAYSTSR